MQLLCLSWLLKRVGSSPFSGTLSVSRLLPVFSECIAAHGVVKQRRETCLYLELEKHGFGHTRDSKDKVFHKPLEFHYQNQTRLSDIK